MGSQDPQQESTKHGVDAFKETVEKNLMQKLGEAASNFEQAYSLMMSIIGDLEENYYEDKKKRGSSS